MEDNSAIRPQLSALTNSGNTQLSRCADDSSKLEECGQAPAIADITKWLNTADGKPVTLSSLKGKVVLVDFWTYSFTAGADAQLVLHFHAQDIYLVLAGHGTVTAAVSGSPMRTIQVSGTPNDHTVFTSSSLRTGILTLSLSPGLQAYDLTFG